MVGSDMLAFLMLNPGDIVSDAMSDKVSQVQRGNVR